MFNREIGGQNYNFPLIQQSATVSPRMFAHDTIVALHLQQGQSVTQQLAQSLAFQTTPAPSVH